MINKKLLEIIDKNNYIWERRLSENKVNRWLENFCGEICDITNEKDIAFHLLNHFLYFNDQEIRYLCKNAFTLFKRKIIQENPIRYLSENENNLINEFLQICRYSYIGRISESGSYLCYQFRQENKIPVSHFINPIDVLLQDVGTLRNYVCVFIDDFLGTGNTGYEFWDNNLRSIFEENPDIKFVYIALVALKRGVELITSRTGFDLICPQILAEDCTIFSESSAIFPIEEKRLIAREVCEYYGRKLVNEPHILGYMNSQALIGFHHNIPDNTLPVIWSENKWNPLFRRAPKE